MKELINPKQNRGKESLIWIATTLVSGLVIILSVSPDYLLQLNPFTLLLLSVACSLPVWALNQLLWWQVGRSISAELVRKVVYIVDVSENHKKEFSFALNQLFKLLDIVRFIPHTNIANLVTIISIYFSAAVLYFMSTSPAILYSVIVSSSLLIWLVSLFILHRICRKIDVQPLRDLWRKVKSDDALLAMINSHFVRIEEIILSLKRKKDDA